MRVGRLVALVAVSSSVMLVGVGLNVSSSSAQGRAGASAAAARRAARRPARFVTKCNFTHRLSDDPIVKPNQPGASHSHDFFGNTTTNAASTSATLNTSGTTCIDSKDHSGYWVPSLTVNGVLVQPTFANVYYQNAGKPFRTIKTIPRGLEVVAGDAMATTPQSLQVVSWNCSAQEEEVGMTSSVPTCPSPTLTLHVNFPDCWNGTALDSWDHKSHLATHNADGTCPSGYPIPIPRVRVNAHYPTTGGPGVALASGGQYSGHADFFNAWEPKEIQRLVRTCINAGRICKPQRR